ncbi:MAG: type I-G CRISPR-associated RAMP protein Csb1/Cas7g [Trebonia sp.]
MAISYSELRDGVAGAAVGIRCRTELQPLGGAGDKVFPPTYAPDSDARTKYALEERLVPSADGATSEVVQAVVLDSVASQANRFELALLEAIRRGDLAMPVTSVDFAGSGLAGLDKVSDYEAPHRIFDSLLRDSYDGENLFRNGAVGRAITGAKPRDAAALYHHSPHTLVFGGWDSTGPRGGHGAKYERAITSEIVALDIRQGSRTASRIDPVGIEKGAGPLYASANGASWELDPANAALDDKGKPLFLGAKEGGKGETGRPSQANHGNVTPTIDKNGGITARRITGVTTLSLIQLRRLRFPASPDGTAFDAQRVDAEVAARTALAALGLAAAALAFEEGFDLRSRCVLVANGPIRFELVKRDGSIVPFDLSSADAVKLAGEGAERAAAAGLPWRSGELLLRPAERLVELIRRSQDIAAVAEAGAR